MSECSGVDGLRADATLTVVLIDVDRTSDLRPWEVGERAA
jgi:hypothetical protein